MPRRKLLCQPEHPARGRIHVLRKAGENFREVAVAAGFEIGDRKRTEVLGPSSGERAELAHPSDRLQKQQKSDLRVGSGEIRVVQSVGRRHRMNAGQRSAATCAHSQLSRGEVNRIPHRSGAGLAFDEPAGDVGASLFRSRLANRRENSSRNGGIGTVRNPAVTQLREGVLRALQVARVTLIVERVAVHLLLFAEIEQTENQRAQRRLRVLPPDDLQRAIRVGDEDGFVADVAVIARAVAPQHGEDFTGAAVAGERDYRALGALDVPRLHRGRKLGGGPVRRGKSSVNRTHGEIARRRFSVALLRRFEIVKRIEERQQPRVGRRFQADQVGRVDDEHTVQRESRRTRIDVANAGQEQRRQHLPVRDATP